MNKFCTFTIFSLLCSADRALAVGNCIATPAEYKSNESIPATFKTLPVMFTYESSLSLLAAGAVKIRAVENTNKLKLEGHTQFMTGRQIHEDQYISQLCIEGEKLEITLENKKSYSIELDPEDNTVDIKGFTFAKSNDQEFNRIKNQTSPIVTAEKSNSGVK